MVEGGGSSEFRTIKTMMYARPDLLHAILRTNTDAVTGYLNAQIEAAHFGKICSRMRASAGKHKRWKWRSQATLPA